MSLDLAHFDGGQVGGGNDEGRHVATLVKGQKPRRQGSSVRQADAKGARAGRDHVCVGYDQPFRMPYRSRSSAPPAVVYLNQATFRSLNNGGQLGIQLLYR